MKHSILLDTDDTKHMCLEHRMKCILSVMVQYKILYIVKNCLNKLSCKFTILQHSFTKL